MPCACDAVLAGDEMAGAGDGIGKHNKLMITKTGAAQKHAAS
jgi:hypothetical protein